MHILVAPNPFKHALSSFEVAEMIVEGLRKSKLQCEFTVFPIADGGNGTLDLVISKINGETVPVKVNDPLGRVVNSRFAYISSSETAVVEMAEASGIHLLENEERNPMLASSFGTGELMKHALDMGARKIILGLGGSASIDGGVGILQALGIKFLNEKGLEIGRGGKALGDISSIDMGHLHPKIKDCEILVACDVNSPLLGDMGAAKVFGPQKGASNKDVVILENNLKHFADVVLKAFNIDVGNLAAGGAAGGISAGLHGIINARLVNGLEYLLEITNFEEALKQSDLLITAEGKFDSQTLEGKGPFGVANIAKKHDVPVVVFAGQVSEDIDISEMDNIEAVFSISRGPGSLETAISNTGNDIRNLAEQVGNIIQMSKKL